MILNKNLKKKKKICSYHRFLAFWLRSVNGDRPNLFSEKLGSLRAPFVIVFKRMAEASAHSSGVRDVVCEDQSCEKKFQRRRRFRPLNLLLMLMFLPVKM